jgi:hypothetical protein
MNNEQYLDVLSGNAAVNGVPVTVRPVQFSRQVYLLPVALPRIGARAPPKRETSREPVLLISEIERLFEPLSDQPRAGRCKMMRVSV